MAGKLKRLLSDLVLNRLLLTALIVFLVLMVTSGFVWMQTERTIAPPGLRIMDALWRMFFM